MNIKCFQFNINKCVGCHACVVACSIENKAVLDMQWRGVTSFNPSGYPDIPLFHYSLACNHCQDAPCMENCPALAYSKDKITGAVIHHPEKCMGCRYCTWACPYDAPKFNPKKGIVEKCTFCNNRITENLKPACANNCPTGALDFIDMPENIEFQDIPGFTDTGIKPSIKIIPPAKEKPVLVCSETQIITRPDEIKEIPSKITIGQEWPLVVFTIIASLMVSLFTAITLKIIKIDPLVFIIPGAVGMFLTFLHLGKKIRAWRSVFNLKGSWLSREILFFMLFYGLGIVNLIYVDERALAFTVVILGVLALFSIDKVYELAVQPVKIELHSAHVLLGYFLYTALFLNQYLAFIVIALIKTVTYVYRKKAMWRMKKKIRLFLSAWRLDMLLSFPLIFWFFGFSNLQWWIFASVLVGEIIDRCEYYDELDVITPQKQVEKDLGLLD